MTTIADTVSNPSRLVNATTSSCNSDRLRAASTDVNPLSSISRQPQLTAQPAGKRDIGAHYPDNSDRWQAPEALPHWHDSTAR